MAFPVLGALSLGLGAASFLTGQKADAARAGQERQNYRDQLKFQEANDTYARFMAKINAKTTDTEKQYRYWSETVNYNQNLAYVNQLRNWEVVKGVRQAQLVAKTRTASLADYSGQAKALSAQLQEAATADAVSYMQFVHQGAKARGTLMATEREGKSMDRLIGDYARQVEDFQTVQRINRGFRENQYTRAQASQIAQHLSRYNSQQFYEAQPYQDPLPPFQPLPTLVMPQAPSMTGAGPANMSGINTMSNLLGSVNTGLSLYSGLKQFTSSGKQA